MSGPPTPEQLIERWTNVLRVLCGLSAHVRRHHWNMGTWGNETECGTVTCAAGHCGMDPWFRRRGFRYDPNWQAKIPHHGRRTRPFDEYAFGVSVREFFGEKGASGIFYDSSARPVSRVILEVKRHINYLKEMR